MAKDATIQLVLDTEKAIKSAEQFGITLEKALDISKANAKNFSTSIDTISKKVEQLKEINKELASLRGKLGASTKAYNSSLQTGTGVDQTLAKNQLDKIQETYNAKVAESKKLSADLDTELSKIPYTEKEILAYQEKINSAVSSYHQKTKQTGDIQDESLKEMSSNANSAQLSFKELVARIYALRRGGKDASVEFSELSRRLDEFRPSSASIAEMDKFLQDVGDAIKVIRKDLEDRSVVDDVFTRLKTASISATKAQSDLNAEIKRGVSDEQSEVNFAYALLETIRQIEAEREAETAQYNANAVLAYTAAVKQAREEERARIEQAEQDRTAEVAQHNLNYITALTAAIRQERAEQKATIDQELSDQQVQQNRDVINSTYALLAAYKQVREEEKARIEQERQDQLEQNNRDAVNSIYALVAAEKDFRAEIIAVKADVQGVAGAIASDPAKENIAELIRRYQVLYDAKKQIEDMGLPKDLDGTYATTMQLLAQLTEQINEYKKSLEGVSSTNKRAEKSVISFGTAAKAGFSGISSLLKTVKNGFGKIGGAIKSVKSHFDRMSSSMKSNFKHHLTSITKYVLGFRSLFFLVRRLRKYIGEGIQNMAKFNDGNNHVNQSITRLLSSLLYLKNAWATAFSPILQFVTPMLEFLIDKLAAVGNAFSRFLGAILGQKTVFQAVKVQAQDYASSLNGVGSSAGSAADKAKKLKDRLASFDDLNVLGKDDDTDGSGSGGGGGLADAYTPDPNDMFKIVEAQSELADRVKAAWQQSLDSGDFSTFGEQIGSSIRDGIVSKLQSINWDNAKETASNIGEGAGGFIATLFGTPDLWVTLGHTVGETLNTINTGISSFLDFFEQGEYGKSMGEGLNEFLDTTDFELAGDNINRVFTDALDNIKDFIDTIDSKEAADAIHNFIQGLDIPEIIWKIGEVIVEAAKLIINVSAELAVEWGDDFGGWLYDKLGGDSSFNLSVGKAFNNIDDSPTGQFIITAFRNVFGGKGDNTVYQEIYELCVDTLENAFFDGVKAISWKSIGERFKIGLDEFWTTLENTIWGDENWEGGIAEWFTDLLGFDELYDWAKSGGTDVTTGFWDGIKEGWNNFWDWFMGLFDGLKTWVEECFDIHSPSGVFEGYGINIMDGLWNGLAAAWENVKLFFSNIKTWISDTWTNIKNKTAEVWNNIKDWLSNTWESIKTKVSSTFTVIKSKILYIWESIKEGIKTPINAILGVVESFVNKCIDGINSLIEKLNSIPDIKITNPFNGQEYTLGLNIPTIKNISIPRLAQGAVIPPNREFMAVLGDQSHGTNIEAPLDTIKQAVAEVLANNGNEEVIRLLQQLIGVVESKELVIGDKDIGKANARYTAQQQLIRGVSF